MIVLLWNIAVWGQLFFRLRIHTSSCVLPKILYGMGYAFNFVPISLSWRRPRSPWAPLHLYILNICCLGPVEAAPTLNSPSNSISKSMFMVSVHASFCALSEIHIVVSVHARHLAHFSEILWYGLCVQPRSHSLSWLRPQSPWAPLHLYISWTSAA